MTILFVLENYHPRIGGVETLFKSLTEVLIAEGHTCVVITTWPGGDVPRRESAPGLKIIRIRTVSRYLFTFFACVPVLRQLRACDLVHTTSYNAALPAYLATRCIRRKVIITFHEVWGKLWFRLPVIGFISKWGHYLFEQLLLRLRFDRFIAVSEFTAMRLRESGVRAESISVIYPGIDYAEFDRTERVTDTRDENKFTYTYYGRLGYSKGLDILLKAATEIQTQLPASRLQLILPTEPRSMYKWVNRYIDAHDLRDHVILRHHLPFDELKNAIRQSDCVVIPSYSEGFCFVAAETIALGVPVISSDQAALKEVIGGKYLRMHSLDSKSLVGAIMQASKGEWEEGPVKRFPLSETVKKYLLCYMELEKMT